MFNRYTASLALKAITDAGYKVEAIPGSRNPWMGTLYVLWVDAPHLPGACKKIRVDSSKLLACFEVSPEVISKIDHAHDAGLC